MGTSKSSNTKYSRDDSGKKISFSRLEKKWQKRWENAKAFRARDGKGRKFYCLEMYPYPSASGLHMGHALNYSIGDIYARFKRMNGFNVLYPMGFDSFGLPAENAAVKEGAHPKKFTESAIKNYIRQMKELGLSYDWSRMIMSHDPEYYKWNQYFFLKFLERGLAYRKKASVNWCRKCNSVLANEQVHNGKCWRHKDCEVEVKQLEQWFLKTTKYADELLRDIEKLEWPERIKIMQRNWIGRSEGSEIIFRINREGWRVFTTRADTLFGVTFLVISAGHPRLMDIVSSDRKKEVEKFLKKTRTTKQEDIDKLDKEGVFTGAYAEHPLTGEKIPVWAGNFVIAEYGSGMVMGVPAHDSRDFDFAKKYKIPIKVVVQNDKRDLDATSMKGAFEGFGVLVNSKGFDGLKSEEAREHITNALESKKLGGKSVQYKLRDWLISRQRYWGTPIPVVYCADCGVVPVPYAELPVLLPEKVKFGKGNPLATNKKFVEVKCGKCGRKARRETDTMDTFFDSSWYYMRYCDSGNRKKAFELKKVGYWMPVNQYIGGAEHAVMHLIYARFFTKALRDLGFVKIDEPFPKLFNQGMLHKDGEVMSKSGGNVVLPEEVSKKYGIDTARLFLVSAASPDKDMEWSDKGVEGSLRFIKKVLEYFDRVKIGKTSRKVESKLNKAIKEITEDIDNFRYNFAVIKLRELFDAFEGEISRKELESFVKLLSVFCPHIGEELWEGLGNKGFVSLSAWPKSDKSKIDERFEKADEAIEQVISDIVNVLKIVKEKRGKEVERVFLYVLPKEIGDYDAGEIGARVGKEVKVFYVSDGDKYDPEGKAKKARAGKPGIYVE